MRRVSKAIEAAISRARRVTRARGSPLVFAAHASAIRSSATTVTRSPLPTDVAVVAEAASHGDADRVHGFLRSVVTGRLAALVAAWDCGAFPALSVCDARSFPQPGR